VKVPLPPFEVISISHECKVSLRLVVSISTVIVSCSPPDEPLVELKSTQSQDSLKEYVRVPVPLFQMSKVVNSVTPSNIFPKSCEVGLYEKTGIGGAPPPPTVLKQKS